MSTPQRRNAVTIPARVSVNVYRCEVCGHRYRPMINRQGLVFGGHCPRHPEAPRVPWTMTHDLVERAIRKDYADLLDMMPSDVVDQCLEYFDAWGIKSEAAE